MKTASKFLLSAGLVLLPFSSVLAASWAPPQNTSGAPSNFTDVIMNAINWILGFITVIAVAAIIWGGIQYITAAGDDNAMKNAKKTITTAILGLVVAGLAYAIVTLITGSIIKESGANTTENNAAAN